MALYGEQEKAAAIDALGVALVGLPMSSMDGGDQGPAIAALKGQERALSEQHAMQDCGGTLEGPPAKQNDWQPKAGAGCHGAQGC